MKKEVPLWLQIARNAADLKLEVLERITFVNGVSVFDMRKKPNDGAAPKK